ncbi:MAG TPA: hypothetical protein VGQ53_14030 [Chitinophagaceae bacterium]|nr:hypothetical protein [Chitinophagaceae bacterium]
MKSEYRDFAGLDFKMISRKGTTTLRETKKILYINIMSRLDKCLPLYIGCETNKGKLVGIVKDSLFIQNGEQSVTEYNKHALGQTLFLYLKKLGDITDEQSQELNKKGFNIGRPSGYTFSNEAFLFLLSLHVDLFGLINSGLAKDHETT